MQYLKSILRSLVIVIGLVFLNALFYAISYLVTYDDSLSYLFSYLLMIIFFIIIYHKDLLKSLKNIANSLKGNIKNITLVCLILTIIIYIANLLIFKLTGNMANNETTVREIFFKNPLLMGINIVILGPIVEEMCYRYPFHNTKTHKLLTYIIYSIPFALAHITSISTLSDLLFFIPYFLLSLSFGYGFYKTNNIFVSTIIHITNNLFNIVLLLL